VMDPQWRHVLLVCTYRANGAESGVRVERQEQVPMRADLVELFEHDELKKYFTAEELHGGTD
jgi:succinate dehydrogenase / fumarate reductase flavoprotein subunit